jgi:hypothetical protein
MRLTRSNVTAISIAACAIVAAVAAAAFVLATLPGDYDRVARLGGAAWVWLLSMIILMPVVIPVLRDRAGDPRREPEVRHD